MLRAILAALLLAASPAVLADLYKCVDAKGKTQYSDKPLPGCKAAAVKGEPPPAPPGKRAEAGKARQPVSGDRQRIVREQAVRCERAQQEFRRGQASDAARETLRGCM